MIEYKHPYFIIFGAIILILWCLDFWQWKKKSQLIWGRSVSQGQVVLGRFIRWMTFGITTLGLCYLVYAAMGPRISQSFTQSNIEVLDIFLVVDVSRSMLADDIPPSRLEVAKKRLQEFATLKPKDRFGIILFSEKVFTLLPLTIDPEMVSKVIDDVNVGYLGSGTNIGDAIALAIARLQITETKNKIIILLTDGVSNVGNMTPLQAAEEAVKYKMKIYTIGLGTDSEARIPVGKGLFGTQYQTIPGGSVDFDMLKKMAEMTGGRAYTAQSDNALQQVLLEINQLERTETKSSGQVIYDELYYYYLVVGLLFFLTGEIMRRFWLKEVL